MASRNILMALREKMYTASASRDAAPPPGGVVVRRRGEEVKMRLTPRQIEYLGCILRGETPPMRDWKIGRALHDRGLLKHDDAWKYPEPYYSLTDAGIAAYTDAIAK